MFSSAHFEMSKSIGQKNILVRNVPKTTFKKNQERLRATPFFLAVGISCKNLARTRLFNYINVLQPRDLRILPSIFALAEIALLGLSWPGHSESHVLGPNTCMQ